MGENRAAAHLVKQWNAAVPVGSPVTVRKDSDEIVETRTRSEAWVLSGHSPVVLLDGIRGCYLLTRCLPVLQDTEGGSDEQ
jgi:hypothetical protein